MLCVVKLKCITSVKNLHVSRIIFPSNKVKITLLQKLLADNEEMNFLYENNVPKDLKSKRSVAVSFAAKP